MATKALQNAHEYASEAYIKTILAHQRVLTEPRLEELGQKARIALAEFLDEIDAEIGDEAVFIERQDNDS